jgi:hypothetical protein
MLLDLLYITIINVIIIDLSGVIDHIKKCICLLFRRDKNLYNDLIIKPFDCSLCMTWWVGLFYLLFTFQISLLNICIVLLYAIFAENIRHIIILIKDILGFICNKLTPK